MCLCTIPITVPAGFLLLFPAGFFLPVQRYKNAKKIRAQHDRSLQRKSFYALYAAFARFAVITENPCGNLCFVRKRLELSPHNRLHCAESSIIQTYPLGLLEKVPPKTGMP